MKIRIFGLGLRVVGLIALVWLFTPVIPAGAQQVTFLSPFAGFKTLYRFCSHFSDLYCQSGEYDGENPDSGLTLDAAGNLWGTTTNGGTEAGTESQGTIFEIDSNGSETTFYMFECCFIQDAGVDPVGGVLLDSAGTAYTTTLYGGSYGDPRCNPPGSLYQGCGAITANGGGSLYSFCSLTNCTDGAFPMGGLIRDASGNFYGTTSGGGANIDASGGYGGGTVFKVDTSGAYSVLYNFCSAANCADGASPLGNLIQDSAGNLYGVTSGGGNSGGGTLFKLDTSGQYSVLYSFCSLANCTDGASPAGVMRDPAGNFYGTTSGGGGHASGTVFRLDTAGSETVLYSFCSAANCADGGAPGAGVIEDAAGSLYGTTTSGGNAIGAGTVFRLDTAGHLTVLHALCSAANCTDGVNPNAIVEDAAGYLYGTTAWGGKFSRYTSGYGTVFKIDTHLKVAGITLTSSVNPSFFGQPLLLSVDVSGQSETPTGVVTFKQGTTILGTASLSGGKATLTITPARSGTVGFSAQYAGDLYNLAATAPLKQVVNRWTTSTAIASSPDPSTHGQLVTLTAEVSSLGGPTPTGYVVFMNGGTVVRNAPINNGVAQIQISNLPVGSLSLTATYQGDMANAKSTSPVLAQVVN